MVMAEKQTGKGQIWRQFTQSPCGVRAPLSGAPEITGGPQNCVGSEILKIRFVHVNKNHNFGVPSPFPKSNSSISSCDKCHVYIISALYHIK